MYFRSLVGIVSSLLATTGLMNCFPVQAQCMLHQVALLPNVNVRAGKTALLRSSDVSRSPILFVAGLKTDTDGARHSYSVEDPWGKRKALNNLCNAMHGECRGLPADKLRARMAVVQTAAHQGWPQDLLRQTRLSENVIAMKHHKPCPLLDGEFLVSTTSLHRLHITDECDIDNYTDSSKVPMIVVPDGSSELAARGVAVGDIVAVMTPGIDKPIFGVIGDRGAPNKLGEASIAMNQALLKRASPKNYTEIKRDWDIPVAYVMVFPDSRDDNNPYMEPDRISAAGDRLLAGHLQEMTACGAQVDSPSK